MGIGQGMLFLPALTVIGHHFKRKRALATGIVVTGASAGGIVFPIMLDFLANRVSFTFAIRISAAVVAVLLLVANALVSAPPQQQQQQQEQDSPSKHVRAILSDAPYVVSVVGCVPFHNCARGGRSDSCDPGPYSPRSVSSSHVSHAINECCSSFDTHPHADFYLQLYAIRQGVPPESAFYSVRPTSPLSVRCPSNPFSARDTECL